MYDLYEARNSIYCYENTDILKNKLNIEVSSDIYEKLNINPETKIKKNYMIMKEK